jgi:hypothetical protein
MCFSRSTENFHAFESEKSTADPECKLWRCLRCLR